MKDEIKEILDYLNKFINDKEEITKYGCEISVKNAKLLLDCITNLQEELKSANESITWWQNRFNALQKENEKLKHNLEQMYNDTKDTYNEINAEQIDYKSRNEKAIEYIEERKNLNWYADGVFVYELLNILQGSDKE